MLIDRLQRRLGEGYGGATSSLAQSPAAAEVEIDRLRESIADAETALELARSGAPLEDVSREERERELAALRAKAEDQAGQIARLEAALGTFEKAEDPGAGLRNSRLALKARAGSAEAQAERQAETIGRLRAELAAAHERLAQQAAHFMDEMRRIGAGASPATGQGRTSRSGRAEHRRRQAERVSQVTTRRADTPKEPAAPALLTKENGAGNGSRPPADAAHAPPATQPAAVAAMPETAALPQGGGRKGRLVDRITGLVKP
jgi:chromosome segregation ATPase